MSSQQIFYLLLCVSSSLASLPFYMHSPCDCPSLPCQPPRPANCPPAYCPPAPPCHPAFAIHHPQYQVQYPLQYPTQYRQTPYTQQTTVPVDELEMRAAAAGITLHSHNENGDRLKVLENLGENDNLRMVEEDLDLVPGLRKADVRRSPTVQVFAQSTLPPLTEEQQDEDKSGNKAETVATGPEGTEETPKCNSQVLKKLMHENMSDVSSESKRKINLAAEEKFGGNVDVVCSRGHFSYVFSSNLYCETTKGLVTCIAFRQAV